MYSYSWDPSTGGLLLNSSPLAFSKEPRPVYYKELDILGFDQHWNYAKDDTYPFMWAEANNYYYRGRLVAKTKGGSLYTAPEIVIVEEPEPDGRPLRYVDIPLYISISDLSIGRDKVTRRIADQFILDVLYLGYITRKKQDYSKLMKNSQIVIDYNKLK